MSWIFCATKLVRKTRAERTWRGAHVDGPGCSRRARGFHGEIPAHFIIAVILDRCARGLGISTSMRTLRQESAFEMYDCNNTKHGKRDKSPLDIASLRATRRHAQTRRTTRSFCTRKGATHARLLLRGSEQRCLGDAALSSLCWFFLTVLGFPRLGAESGLRD